MVISQFLLNLLSLRMCQQLNQSLSIPGRQGHVVCQYGLGIDPTRFRLQTANTKTSAPNQRFVSSSLSIEYSNSHLVFILTTADTLAARRCAKNFEHTVTVANSFHSVVSLRQAPCATELDLGADSCYNISMKRLLITVYLVHALSGCAVYTATSIVTAVATDKSITDYVASGITGSDCSTVRTLTGEKDFYCERVREPGTSYNRNGY